MKILIKTAMFFILVIFLLAPGCADESVTAGSLNNPVQPLAVGFQWVFVDSIFTNGNVSTGTTRIVVSQKSFLPSFNQEVFNWQVFGDNQLLRTNFVNTDGDGLWHFGEINGSDTLLAKKQWAKYPVNINDNFQEPRYSYDSSAHKYNLTETWTWTCISKDYEITLQNGNKIKCIVFKSTDSTGAENDLLYSENVGYAGWITRVNNEIIFNETLSSYNVK